jgi:hypothetical protein
MKTATELIREKDNWTEIKTRDQYLAFREWVSKLTKSVDDAIDEKNKNYIGTITLNISQQERLVDMMFEEFNYLFDVNIKELEPTVPHWFDEKKSYNSTYNFLKRFHDKIAILAKLVTGEENSTFEEKMNVGPVSLA